MVVTAAVVTAATAVGAGAYQGVQAHNAAQAAGQPLQQPTQHGALEDPINNAMRTYYGRLQMANTGTRYPAFSSFLQSGGDPSKAQMNVQIPQMSPFEAEALGFVGTHGTPVTTVGTPDQAGNLSQTGLTPQQRLYLAQQHVHRAIAAGLTPGGWQQNVVTTQHRLGNVNANLASLQGIQNPTDPQQDRIDALTKRQANLQARQKSQLGGLV